MRNLQRVPDGFKISDFDNCVLPVISAMVEYHPIMDRARQVGLWVMTPTAEYPLVSSAEYSRYPSAEK